MQNVDLQLQVLLARSRNTNSGTNNHTQATPDVDRTALRRQQDVEYTTALAEDLARQRPTEQEGGSI